MKQQVLESETNIPKMSTLDDDLKFKNSMVLDTNLNPPGIKPVSTLHIIIPSIVKYDFFNLKFKGHNKILQII